MILRNYNVVISMDVDYIVEGIIMSGQNYNVRKGRYNSCVLRNYNGYQYGCILYCRRNYNVGTKL